MLYEREELKEKMSELPHYTLKNYLSIWESSLGHMQDEALKEELKVYIEVLKELTEE